MNDLFLIVVGLIFIIVGIVYLYIKVSRQNSVQGAVSQINILLLMFFGMLAWKRNIYPLLFLIAGVVCIAVALL